MLRTGVNHIDRFPVKLIYVWPFESRVAMRHLSNILALCSLALVLASPVAWGCEGTGMENCAMAACPMGEGHGAREVTAPSHCGQDAAETTDCAVRRAVSVDCCDAPAERPLAESAPGNPSVSRHEPPSGGTTGLQVEAPPPLPVDATCVVRTQQHELGRFTMLSSYLL